MYSLIVWAKRRQARRWMHRFVVRKCVCASIETSQTLSDGTMERTVTDICSRCYAVEWTHNNRLLLLATYWVVGRRRTTNDVAFWCRKRKRWQNRNNVHKQIKHFKMPKWNDSTKQLLLIRHTTDALLSIVLQLPSAFVSLFVSFFFVPRDSSLRGFGKHNCIFFFLCKNPCSNLIQLSLFTRSVSFRTATSARTWVWVIEIQRRYRHSVLAKWNKQSDDVFHRHIRNISAWMWATDTA